VSLERIAGFFQGTFNLPVDAIVVERVEPWTSYPEFIVCATANQVRWYIMSYENGKSAGPSGMKMELLKPIADWIADPLSIMFDRMVTVGLVPSEWRLARIVPIPKKEGATDIKDHRPISLTEVVRKVFEKCIRDMLVSEIGHAHFAQGGFEPEKGTIDQVAALNETMQMRKTREGEFPCVAFLDIAKAYDSVDRNILWNRLMEKRCNPAVARVVMALFDGVRSKVAVGGRETREIEHRAGLLQGSVLSPMLYNLYIGAIMEKLMAANSNDPLTSFWYADDGAVVAKSPEEMQRLLTVAEEFSREMNFRFNPRKCEVMNCGRPVRIYGEVVPTCTQFKYLGVWFGEEGADWFLHFSKMVEKGERTLNFWRSIGFNGGGFGLRTRRMVFTTFLRPVVEYGLAIMPYIVKIITMLERFQGEALVAMFGVGRTTCRKSMRGLAMVTSYQHRWWELGARWEARVMRRSRNHMTTVLRELLGNRRLLVKQSAFAKFGSNPILLRHAVATVEYENLQRAVGRKNPKPLPLQVTVLEWRQMHLRTTLDNTRRLKDLPVDKDCKARTLYSLSRLGVRTCRFVVKWMLGRYTGKPCRCLVCNVDRCSSDHFITCCRAQSLNALCCSRRWAQALPLIQRILSRAAGYDRVSILQELHELPPAVDDPVVPEPVLRVYG
jgi:Reverse transcriptase (RNA-dependent DNA polymerase)